MDYSKEKEAFLAYANQYDRSNGMIELKVVHTLRVVSVMDSVTKALGLPDETRFPVVAVEGRRIVIVFQVEILDADMAEHGPRHGIELAFDGLLESGGGTDDLPVVGVISGPRVRIQVHLRKIRGIQPVETIEGIHGRIPVGQ